VKPHHELHQSRLACPVRSNKQRATSTLKSNAYGTNVQMIERMAALVGRMDSQTIERLVADGNPARTFEYLSQLLMPGR
jgi:hypothetical protein